MFVARDDAGRSLVVTARGTSRDEITGALIRVSNRRGLVNEFDVEADALTTLIATLESIRAELRETKDAEAEAERIDRMNAYADEIKRKMEGLEIGRASCRERVL